MTEISRRQVLRGLAACATTVAAPVLAAPALAAPVTGSLLTGAQTGVARASGRGSRLAFSTLGCPAWSLAKVLDEAARLGYGAVEMRGLEGEMDLTQRPEFQGSRIAETRDRFAARGVAISDLGASSRMHEALPAVRAAHLDEGRRYIDLAHALGAPYIRVFPDKLVPAEPREKTVARIVEGLRTLGTHAKGSGVTVLIESHGDFTRSPDLREILAAVDLPEVALLWDTHHTIVFGQEAPAATWKALGRFIRHVHLKDSRAEGDGVRYVLTGEGRVPVRETVRVLLEAGYPGYYCFEWEKKWHPEIEDPEVAFPHYARVMEDYLATAAPKA